MQAFLIFLLNQSDVSGLEIRLKYQKSVLSAKLAQISVPFLFFCVIVYNINLYKHKFQNVNIFIELLIFYTPAGRFPFIFPFAALTQACFEFISRYRPSRLHALISFHAIAPADCMNSFPEELAARPITCFEFISRNRPGRKGKVISVGAIAPADCML